MVSGVIIPVSARGVNLPRAFRTPYFLRMSWKTFICSFCASLFQACTAADSLIPLMLPRASVSANFSVFVDDGFIIGPQSLDTWFDATLPTDVKTVRVGTGRPVDGTADAIGPEYLDWLSQPSPYSSRSLANYARKVEDVSRAVAQRSQARPDQVESVLALTATAGTEIARQCPLPEPSSPCQAAKFRTFSGQCNNVQHPLRGKSETAFGRTKQADYADGVAKPRRSFSGDELPDAAQVSGALRQDVDKPHEFVNQMVAVWAQLVEDDISKVAPHAEVAEKLPTLCCKDPVAQSECFPIIFNNGTCLHYLRSLSSPLPDCHLTERQQMNLASHYLDGSGIYGSADGFQAFFDDQGSLWMKTNAESMDIAPEIMELTSCVGKSEQQNCFGSHASKARGTAYAPLTALKTLWMREHNRIAKILRSINPHWDSAIIFQSSRRIVASQIQHITFREFLPLVVGQTKTEEHDLRLQDVDFYKGYDMDVDPSIENGFAVAGLKFWMGLVESKVEHLHKNGSKISRSSVKEYLDHSKLLEKDGIDGYIRGLVHQPSKQPGHGVTENLSRHWLQGPQHSYGLDLPALTLQRGRDHGIAGYNSWREWCGLPAAASFEDLQNSIPDQMVEKLKKIYRTVDDVDLFVGALSETPLKTALVGPVLACLIGKQFAKLRKSDRFWYEMDLPPSSFSSNQLNELRKASLSRIICDNADNITHIQPHAMLQPDSTLNSVVHCMNLPSLDLSKWREQTALFGMLTDPPVQEADNGSEAVLERVRRQGFRFGGGGNFRQGRQLQPVNQFQNFQFNDNSCGEKSNRCDADSKFRSISGHCNNLNQPEFGEIDRVFTRFMGPAYDDGVGSQRETSVVGGALPPVRAVRTNILTDVDRPHPKYTVSTLSREGVFVVFSNADCWSRSGEDVEIFRQGGLEALCRTLVMQFGQFLDHDFTNTPMATGNGGSFLNCRECNSEQAVSSECKPIRVPQGDPVMASLDRNGRPLCLSFTRSQSRRGSDGRRQQVNQLSSYLDAGTIYGTTACLTRRLRSFNGGRLITTRNGRGGKDLLQQSTNRNDVESSECRSVDPNNRCFLSGDARANEHPALATVHTVWVREHNRIADGLRALNPQWNDQKLFDETRRIVIAEMQHITYNEWIPRVVGRPVASLFGLSLLKSGFYNDYDETCDAGISNEFSTAAFRFGHSLVPARFGRYDNTFQSLGKPLNLFEHFSRADALYDNLGVDQILIGLTIEPTQNADFSFTDMLSNHLFQDTGRPLGTDLVAINVQRGRDHGLPGYNSYRARCNMTRAQSFDDLLGDIPQFLVDRLSRIYRHVDDIDLFTGGTVELPVVGGLVGPTFSCIIGEQFLRLRRCDRFWYETASQPMKFSTAQLAAIRKVTMAKVACQNSDTLNQVQRNVFDLPDTFQNAHVSCDEIDDLDLAPWREVSTCTVSGQRIEVGETKRVSPCIQCSCASGGPDCRSMHIKSCKDLLQDFTAEQISADDVCKVQCAKDFFDSADKQNNL